MLTIAFGVAGGILLAIAILAFLPWIAQIAKVAVWLLFVIAASPFRLTRRIAGSVSVLPRRTRYALLFVLGFAIIVFSVVHSWVIIP